MIGETKPLPPTHDVLAPDGSEVRILLARPGGSMAHFRLMQGQVSRGVRHRSVEEIWYILSGTGQMWQSDGTASTVFDLHPGVSLTIPAGAAFQFRATGPDALTAVAITMPPWPGDAEAEPAPGLWIPGHMADP